MANTTQARGSSTMDRKGREGETTGDGEGQSVEANERGTGRDEREGRVRGRVISFLCLLLIYSDAPRLSASGANKFLEPPWQLDTLPSSRTFSPGLPSPPVVVPPRHFFPARSTAATRYSGRIEQPRPSAPRRPM